MIYKIEDSCLRIKTAKDIYEAAMLHMSLVDSIIIDLTDVKDLDTGRTFTVPLHSVERMP